MDRARRGNGARRGALWSCCQGGVRGGELFQLKKRLKVVYHVTDLIFLHFVAKNALKQPVKLLMSLVTIDVIHVK